jgi:hypothetical protein
VSEGPLGTTSLQVLSFIQCVGCDLVALFMCCCACAVCTNLKKKKKKSYKAKASETTPMGDFAKKIKRIIE